MQKNCDLSSRIRHRISENRTGSRTASPGAAVLVRGRRLPLVGRVSMDAVTVDVTDLPGLDYTEEFVLLGSQGGETITAGELARRRNTIAWEVLTSMAQRLARVYHPAAGTARADQDSRSGPV